MLIQFLLALSTLTARAENYQFPPDFQWCVATAGHQVEGDNDHSDWWEWEKLPGKIRNGDRSGKASHHMERLEEDVQWMKKLGVKTYRFSIEWSRLEPKPGVHDPQAVAYYHREIDLLKKNGIRPFVTLHHFVQPQWFTASGGWRRADSPQVFLDYVKFAEDEFGGDVDTWVTFNEPSVILMGAYGLGVMPPGESGWDLWDPTIHMLQAHAKAYRYLHERAQARGKNISVGFAFHIRPLVPASSWLKRPLVFLDFMTNWSLAMAIKTGELHSVGGRRFLGIPIPWPRTIQLDELKGTQDFFGMNYYTREYISLSFKPPFFNRDPLPGLVGSELLNWGIDPEGFYFALQKAHELFPELPIMITENGITDPSDRYRPDYIRSHLAQLNKAMNEIPVHVLGYCHWSLMDNFEWIEGFTPRFGLLEVDYKTGDRKPRPSFEMLSQIFKTGKLEYSTPKK